MSDEEKSLDKPQPDVMPASPEFGDRKEIEQLHLIGIEHEKYSGPLPSPQMFAEYNKVVPNAAERILVVFENQAKHRQSIEKTVIEGGATRAKLGLILGFILALAALFGSFVLIWNGRDVAGLTTFITALAGLVGIFIYQTRERKNERLARSKTKTERSMKNDGQ